MCPEIDNRLVMQRLLVVVCALWVGWCGVFAKETPKVVLDFSTKVVADTWSIGSTKLAQDATYTNGTYSIRLAGCTSGYYINLNGADSTSLIFGRAGASLQLPSFNFVVKRIVVHGTSQCSSDILFSIFAGEEELESEGLGCATPRVFYVPGSYLHPEQLFVLRVLSKHDMQISKIEIFDTYGEDSLALEHVRAYETPEIPIFLLNADNMPKSETVELQCATAGAEIRYTTDGTAPTVMSALYTQPLVVTATTTIRAVAVYKGIMSEVATAKVQIVKLEGTGTKDNPYSVNDISLMGSTGKKAWIRGFVLGNVAAGGAISKGGNVGGDILLGTKASCKKGAPVLLCKNSEAYTLLNLKNSPNLRGAEVMVYGEVASYMGAKGLKNVSQCEVITTSVLEVDVENKSRKVVENGQIYFRRNGEQYNVLGKKVK